MITTSIYYYKVPEAMLSALEGMSYLRLYSNLKR